MTVLPPGLLPRFLVESRGGAGVRSGAAAVLFADLSGFTALAERLSQQGPAGTEELSRLLNASFGPMVGEILDAGGDIVRFAGDAPIALFAPASDESLGDVVRRAEACGQRLQLGLAEVARSEQIALTMRVTISAGDVTRRVLGGHEGRFEWFVGGDAFAQLAATQAKTAPGEVTLTPAAQAYLDASPAARAIVDAVTDEVPLRAFVSRGLLARLDAGHDDLLAERRLVSVLFVRLAGPQGEAEPSAEQLAPSFRALQRAVYSRGGSVNQFLRDDKGTVLVAAWGVPGCVHEDQAARALDAAREGLAALKALGVSASAGVATGRVFCGWRGEPRRREYAIIGDVMNLAARLMTLEESGGRCDEATAQAARGAMRLAERAPVQLKGKAAPVPVYGLEAGSSSPMTAETPVPGSPLLGRDAEKARIAAVLAVATNGESAALLLTGEPGTGKTRLLDDAAATATGRVLRTGPSAIGAADAFHAWRPLLEQWIALPGRRGDPADLDARRTALDAWIAARPAARDAAALLRRLLQIADPDARVSGRIVLPTGRTTQELSSASFDAGDALRELLLTGLEEFSAQGPVLLIVDEAHALDSLSLRVAHEALRRLPRLAVLFAARPISAGRNADLDGIAADPRVGQLVIGPLDAIAVESLVAHRLGVTRIPAAVARLVAERSGGNALFAGELAASLRDEGLLLVSDGTCRLTLADGDLAAHRFPDSVQGVVAGRFDRLDAPQQLTLKVASVIGSVFALAALERLHPVPASGAARRQEIDRLVANGVLEALPDGVDRFAFRSTVMQEVAYGLLPVAQREAMHAAAADYFEFAPSVVWAIVAHHRMRTADAGRAIDALERALEEAAADGADRETARAGERLIAYAAEGKAADRSRVEIARWIRQAAHARIRLGENRHGRTMIERALEELGYHVPHWRVTLVGRLLREMLRQGLHLAIPSRWWRGGSRRRAEVRLEAAVAAGHLPPLAFYEYDTLAYVTFCLVSVNLAEAADAPSTAGEGYAALGFIAATAGLTKLAERWWGIGEREGDALSRHNVMIARSLHLMARGDLTASEAMARRTVELARAARDWTAYEKGLWMVFSSRQTIGDVRGASQVTEALFASASGRDHRQHLLWAHVGRASVAMESGDAAVAASECDASEALIAGADPSTRLVYWTSRLRHSVWSGDVERTKRDVVELSAILGPSGDIPSSLSRTNLADARLLLWDRATNAAERAEAQREARRLLQQLRASLRYVPVYRSRADRFAGDVAWREGDADAARAHWQRAIESASNIPLDAAIAHLRLASHGVDETSRRAHAESARQLLAPFDQRALLASISEFPS